ncbi:MAG: V-type ATP synthase subunit F [Myxococcota bacterium]
MGRPVFIGDEVTAAGYRLAGLDVRVPPPEDAGEALRAARATAPIVLVTAEVVEHVPADQMRAALEAPRPLTVVVGDVRGRRPAPDIGADLRRRLGME